LSKIRRGKQFRSQKSSRTLKRLQSNTQKKAQTRLERMKRVCLNSLMKRAHAGERIDATSKAGSGSGSGMFSKLISAGTYLLTYLLTCLLAYLLTYYLACLLAYLLTYLLACLLTYFAFVTSILVPSARRGRGAERPGPQTKGRLVGSAEARNAAEGHHPGTGQVCPARVGGRGR